MRCDNNHVAIISKADFDAVQLLLKRDTRALNKENSPYMFSGIIFCGDCGKSMVRRLNRYQDKEICYYVCSSYNRSKACSRHSIKEEFLAEIIFDQLETHIKTMIHVQELASRIKDVSQRLMMLNYLSGDEELKGNKILQFVDDGYSGTNLNRPGMQDMLEKIRLDLVKCVIVKDFSRFSRDHIDLGSYVEQIFPFMGVRFIAINDDYDSKETLGGISGLGDQFKMLIYDYYSKDLSEKVKTSMVALKMQGKFVGGYAPFGYSKDLANRSKLILDEKAAETVRKIFHMALDEMSMYQISQILNEEGIVTPTVYMKQSVGRVDANMTKNLDQQWETGKVKRILDNEIYTGTMVSGKVKAVAVGSSKRVHIPEEEWIRVANTHEAIISAELFDKVKELRADGFFYGTSKYLPYVLSGKVYCGGCGRNMAHSYQGRPKFLCNSRFFGGSGGDSDCGCTDMIRDEDLEAIVIRTIEDAAKKAVSMIEVQKAVGKVVGEKRRGLEDEIKVLDVKIVELEEVLMEKYEEYREEKISREDYLEQKVAIEAKVSNIREKIQLLEDLLVNGLALQMKDVTGLEVLGRYLKVEKLTKELVDVVLEKIVVEKGNVVKVRLRIGNI